MTPDFNLIATIYYPLSRLIFGRAQEKAEQYFLKDIKPDSRILIVGGGNGRILEPLLQHLGDTGSISFVESSAKMITMAKKNAAHSKIIKFHQMPVELFQASERYDVILTSFFFDLFPKKQAIGLHRLLRDHLAVGGIWIDTDFSISDNSPVWQNALLKTMYGFFGAVSDVRTSRLPDLESEWSPGFRLLGEKTSYRKFILSRIWEKEKS